MTIKTPSDLPVFTGDTDMSMHVHKPGSSEKISINELASLITSGDGLQVGDVVLRPAGSYADSYECNGAIYHKSEAPILAGKLNDPAYGVNPTGINAASEVRFEPSGKAYVVKIGDLIASSGGSGVNFYIDRVQRDNATTNSTSQALFKTKKAVYFRRASSIVSAYRYSKITESGIYDFVSFNATSNILGAFEYSETEDLIFQAVDPLKPVKVTHSTNSPGYLMSDISEIPGTKVTGITKVAGNYFISVDDSSFQGIYKLTLGDSDYSLQIVKTGLLPIIKSDDSEYIYVRESNISILKIHPGDLSESRIPTPVSYTSAKIFGDSIICLSRGASLPFYISFNFGASWSLSPTRAQYQDIDYDNGTFVFCGGTGTTGSVNGQSGGIQINAATFPTEDYFRVPVYKSSVKDFKFYIRK